MTFEFKNIITGDQSPSLSLPPTWEPMHSLEGAFSETQYIYQPTVTSALTHAPRPSLLSLGLGLGYNEILIACESLSLKKTPHIVRSFELVSELRECFVSWIQGESSVLNSVYKQILLLYAQKYEMAEEEILKQLQRFLKEGILQVEGPVGLQTELQPMNGILFDAFCAKTSPDLWTPEFLHDFFKRTAGTPSFMSTYACTGELRRALAAAGFTVEKRKGFAFKRESTFAEKH
jgi:S-adenosyl-L-methionine-dependent methyltransferase